MSLELVQRGLTARRHVHRRRPGRPAVRRALQEVHPRSSAAASGRRPRSPWTCSSCAQAQFVQEPGVQGEDVVVLFEMTLKNLREERRRHRRAGLPRPRRHPRDARQDGADLELRRIPPAGRVPVPPHAQARSGSSWACRRCASCSRSKYYADLDGGILESFGRLFKNDLKVYVYPLLDAARPGRSSPRATSGWRRTCAISTPIWSRIS